MLSFSKTRCDIQSKYVIGLSLQESEHKRIQEFGLGAAQSESANAWS